MRKRDLAKLGIPAGEPTRLAFEAVGEVPPSIAESFAQACDDGDGAGCYQLALAIAAGDLPRGDNDPVALRTRACSLGLDVACRDEETKP